MKLNRFSWKQTGLINLSVFFFVATILGVRIIGTPTQTQPKASTSQPSPTSFPLQPHSAPQLHRVYPAFAKPGDEIRIFGTNLGNNPPNAQLMLESHLINSSHISNWTPNYIDITIPDESDTNQISSLSLVLDKNTIASQKLSIYDPDISPEIGLTKRDAQYQLWINNAPPGTWISFNLSNPADIIKPILPNESNEYTRQYHFQVPSSKRVLILTSSTPPEITQLILSKPNQPNSLSTPYFIHPLNRLNPTVQ